MLLDLFSQQLSISEIDKNPGDQPKENMKTGLGFTSSSTETFMMQAYSSPPLFKIIKESI